MRINWEDVKTFLALAVVFWGVPALMFLHWLAFGY